MISTPRQIFPGDHIKDEEMDNACGTDRGNVREYRVFEENFKERSQLECPVF